MPRKLDLFLSIGLIVVVIILCLIFGSRAEAQTPTPTPTITPIPTPTPTALDLEILRNRGPVWVRFDEPVTVTRNPGVANLLGSVIDAKSGKTTQAVFVRAVGPQVYDASGVQYNLLYYLRDDLKLSWSYGIHGASFSLETVRDMAGNTLDYSVRVEDKTIKGPKVEGQ